MLISCLCPTFHRVPHHQYLLEEAIESFLRQDYPYKELIVCNDQPHQTLSCDAPNVRVINCAKRFPSFAQKIDFMISKARGSYFCRWDDDDISLPHRLSYSFDRLTPREGGELRREWRAENYIYAPRNGTAVIDYSHGNTHLTAIWHKSLLSYNRYRYPYQWPGGEDQMFNRILFENGFPFKGDTVPDKDVFYIYRWGVGKHWSGPGGDLQKVYEQLGEDMVVPGEFKLAPHWRQPYSDYVLTAIGNTHRNTQT